MRRPWEDCPALQKIADHCSSSSSTCEQLSTRDESAPTRNRGRREQLSFPDRTVRALGVESPHVIVLQPGGRQDKRTKTSAKTRTTPIQDGLTTSARLHTTQPAGGLFPRFSSSVSVNLCIQTRGRKLG